MSEPPATDLDTTALGILKSVGMIPVAVRLPAWPYHSLNLIEFSEAAAAFEDLTLSLGLDQLKAQFSDAWPNRFRQARFLSAVDFVQTDRFRRKVAEAMAKLFENVDVLLVPSLREEMRTISNFTGHPALTVPAGFVEVTRPRSDWAHDAARKIPPLHPPRKVPHTVTFIGRPFEEGTIARVGRALESELGPGSRRPPDFDC
jgi:Asp-tRNA(Asn)/Glu-tRNA(Gln) amidotransferase A subunit family amidase